MFYSSVAGANNQPLIGWHSIFTPQQIIATVAVSGFPASAMWSGDTYTRWRALPTTSAAEQWGILISNTVGAEFDYMAIAGHNLFSVGATYQLFGFINASKIPLTPLRTAVDDRPIVEHFNAVSYQSIKLEINVPQGQAAASIAHMKIGKMLQLERQVWTGEIPGGQDIRIETIGSKSYAGNHLGSVLISEGEAFAINQKNNTANFVRSPELQNFFKHARGLQKLAAGCVETFFYVWRPAGNPGDVQYCGKTNSFTPPTNQMGTNSGGLMQWSMSGDAFK